MKPEVLKLREDAVATLQARHKIVVTKKGDLCFEIDGGYTLPYAGEAEADLRKELIDVLGKQWSGADVSAILRMIAERAPVVNLLKEKKWRTTTVPPPR